MNGSSRAKRSFRIEDLLRKDGNDNTANMERRNEEFSRRFESEVSATRLEGAIASHSSEQVTLRREIDVLRRVIEVPRRETEVPRREIEALRRETELPRREIEILNRETEMSRREIRAPRREIEVSSREIQMPTEERKMPRCHTLSPQYESDNEMATTLRHESRPVLNPPPRRHTFPFQPAPLRALPISYLTYAGSPNVAGPGWWRGAGRAGGQVRFSPAQTVALERLFAHHKYLTPDERRALAHQLALTDKQVKTWFQNRRAKWRRGGDGDKHQSHSSPSPPNGDR